MSFEFPPHLSPASFLDCRGIVALGTFMSGNQGQEAQKLVKDMDCKAILQKLTSNGSVLVAAKAKEALQMLQR